MSETMETKANEAAENVKAAKAKPVKKKRKGRKRRILKRLFWTIVILAVLGVIGWSVYSRLRADYKITYDTYTATTGSISNSLSFTGSMQLIHSASYTASADAKVREVYVSVGDRVKDGTKLMRLSDGTTIEAEFDGEVSSLNVARGDEVKAEEALATVADFDHMRVSVRVGESNISSVSTGQPCKVTVPSANATFESVIGTIDHVAYTGNNVAYYTTTVDVDTAETENIWPGMQATVTVTLNEAQDVTVLKMEALSTARDNTAFVYKETADGEMEEVKVTVGVSNGNYVEIRDGVASGETVYKIAEKEDTPTGLAALFSGMFTNRQLNRQTNRNWRNQNGNMPDFGANPPGGTYPGGSNPGGSRNSNGGSGGTRGN